MLVLALALTLALALLLLVVVLLRQVTVRMPAFRACAPEAGGGLPPIEQVSGGKARFFSTRKHSSGL